MENYNIENIIDESLEFMLSKHVTTVNGNVTLFHGSPKNDLTTIFPLSRNVGTRLSKPRTSSFWAGDPQTATIMGMWRLLAYIVPNFMSSDCHIKWYIDFSIGRLCVARTSSKELFNILKDKSITVYVATVPAKHVGRGHDLEVGEYSVDVAVKPHTHTTLDFSKLVKSIKVISDSEYISKVEKYGYGSVSRKNISFRDRLIYRSREKTAEYNKSIHKDFDDAMEYGRVLYNNESADIIDEVLFQEWDDTKDFETDDDTSNIRQDPKRAPKYNIKWKDKRKDINGNDIEVLSMNEESYIDIPLDYINESFLLDIPKKYSNIKRRKKPKPVDPLATSSPFEGLLRSVSVDTNTNEIVIKNIDYQKTLLRLNNMYDSKKVKNVFSPQYTAWSLYLFNKEKITRNEMKIKELRVPQFFALEIQQIFYDLGDFYSLKYYSDIADIIGDITWVANVNKPIQRQEVNLSALNMFTIKPLDYQQKYIEEYFNITRCYNFDGHILTFKPGYGKTFTATCIAEVAPNIDQVIVVCPNTVKENWAYELKEYYKKYHDDDETWHREVYVTNNSKYTFFKDSTKWLITNHENILNPLAGKLKNKNVMIIVDESHYFRNIETKSVKSLLELKRITNAKDILMMSGTPIKASPDELIPCLMMIDPMFTLDMAKIYKSAFATDNTALERVIKARFGIVMYDTPADVLKLPKKEVLQYQVKIKDEEPYRTYVVRQKINKRFNEIYTKLNAESGNYREEFSNIIHTYSSNDETIDEQYIAFIQDGANYQILHESKIDLYRTYLKTYVYPNIKDHQELLRVKDVVSRYVTLISKARGIAVGEILPKLYNEVNIKLWDANKDEFIHMIRECLKKTIIFSPYVSVANHIADSLKNNNIGCVKITGSIKGNTRMDLINKFRNLDDIDVLVATDKTMSTGLTLVEASQMFFFGLPYRAADFDQASNRIYRIGQKSDVKIYKVLLRCENDADNITIRQNKILEWSDEMSKAYLSGAKEDSIHYELDEGSTKIKIQDIEDIRQNAKLIKREVDKYKSGGPAGNQNCQLCTWAFVMRCRGYDVLPRPIFSPRDPVLEIDGEKIVKSPVRIKIKSKKDLLNKIHSSDYNAVFYVHVNWSGSSGGHEFLIMNCDDDTVLVDAQVGKVAYIDDKSVDSYFNINYDNSYICRLDDKEINHTIFKYNNLKYLVKWDQKKDVEYMKKHNMLDENILCENTSRYNEVIDIINSIPKSEHHYFYHDDVYKDSDNLIFRDIKYVNIDGKKYGAFIDVYSFPNSPEDAVIIIASDQKTRGSGINMQLVKSALDYVTNHTNIKTIYWKTDVDNVASYKLAIKCGFTLNNAYKSKQQKLLKYEIIRNHVNEMTAIDRARAQYDTKELKPLYGKEALENEWDSDYNEPYNDTLEVIKESTFAKYNNYPYIYLSHVSMDDDLYPVGKCLFKSMDGAVEEYVFRAKNKHPTNTDKLPCELYVHNTEPGIYELRMSDMCFAYWSHDNITLRLIGKIYIDISGNWNWIDKYNDDGTVEKLSEAVDDLVTNVDDTNDLLVMEKPNVGDDWDDYVNPITKPISSASNERDLTNEDITIMLTMDSDNKYVYDKSVIDKIYESCILLNENIKTDIMNGNIDSRKLSRIHNIYNWSNKLYCGRSKCVDNNTVMDMIDNISKIDTIIESLYKTLDFLGADSTCIMNEAISFNYKDCELYEDIVILHI